MDKQDFEKYAEIKPINDVANPVWERLYRKYLDSRRDQVKTLKVLDYGCGDGKYLQSFQSHGIDKENIYGHEVSEKRVQRCHEKGWHNVLHVELHKTLPFDDNLFDFVNMAEVIEHIPAVQTDFYLADIRRMMKDDGVIFISTPNYPVKRFNDRYNVLRHGKWKRMKDDPTHVTFYDTKSLKKRLRNFFPHVEVLCYKEGVFYPRIRRPFFMHKIIALASPSPLAPALLSGEVKALEAA